MHACKQGRGEGKRTSTLVRRCTSARSEQSSRTFALESGSQVAATEQVLSLPSDVTLTEELNRGEDAAKSPAAFQGRGTNRVTMLKLAPTAVWLRTFWRRRHRPVLSTTTHNNPLV